MPPEAGADGRRAAHLMPLTGHLPLRALRAGAPLTRAEPRPRPPPPPLLPLRTARVQEATSSRKDSSRPRRSPRPRGPSCPNNASLPAAGPPGKWTRGIPEARAGMGEIPGWRTRGRKCPLCCLHPPAGRSFSPHRNWKLKTTLRLPSPHPLPPPFPIPGEGSQSPYEWLEK